MSRAPYSVELDLHGLKAVVLGAGAVALRKLKGLPKGLKAVSVVSPEASQGVKAWVRRYPGARLHLRRLRRSDLRGCRLLFCCASDARANAQAVLWGRALGAWVCQAQDPGAGDLQVPALIKAAGLRLTLSTGGASPAAAKALRLRLAASDLAFLLAALKRLRPALKADPVKKRRLMARLTRGAALDLALAPRSAARRQALTALLKL